jgi:serine/threonine protein kinase
MPRITFPFPERYATFKDINHEYSTFNDIHNLDTTRYEPMDEAPIAEDEANLSINLGTYIDLKDTTRYNQMDEERDPRNAAAAAAAAGVGAGYTPMEAHAQYASVVAIATGRGVDTADVSDGADDDEQEGIDSYSGEYVQGRPVYISSRSRRASSIPSSDLTSSDPNSSQFNLQLKDLVRRPSQFEPVLCQSLATMVPKKLHRSDIQLGKMLGMGAYGRVWLGTLELRDNVNEKINEGERGGEGGSDSTSGGDAKSNVGRRGSENTTASTIQVAVKELKPGMVGKARLHFLQEADLMAQFNHDNIVKLIGAVLTNDPLQIIMELCDSSLLALLQNNQDVAPTDQLTPLQLVQCCIDIAQGGTYLATRLFVHRDLACRNIVVSKLQCKIADFGLSCPLGADETYYKASGGRIPVRWCAPECISFKRYSFASDVWAFGIVCYEIWAGGSIPFGLTPNRDVAIQVISGKKLARSIGCPLAVYRLMMQCWANRPTDRPAFMLASTELHRIYRTADLDTSNAVDPTVEQREAEDSQTYLELSTTGSVPTDEEEGSAIYALPGVVVTFDDEGQHPLGNGAGGIEACTPPEPPDRKPALPPPRPPPRPAADPAVERTPLRWAPNLPPTPPKRREHQSGGSRLSDTTTPTMVAPSPPPSTVTQAGTAEEFVDAVMRQQGVSRAVAEARIALLTNDDIQGNVDVDVDEMPPELPARTKLLERTTPTPASTDSESVP